MEMENRLGSALRCALALALLTACACAGCKAQRYVQGVEMSVGLSVPGTDGAAQISFLEYISGIKVSAGTNTDFRVTYHAATSNDYFGIVHVRERYETELETTKSGK